MTITQHFSSPEARIGSVGPLVITCFRTTPTLTALEEIDRAETAVLERFDKVFTLAIAGENSSVLRIDEPVRNRSVELTNKFEGRVRGAAVVIAAKGLSAVMARSFMTAYFLLSRPTAPTQTFASIDAAARWLEELSGGDLTLRTGELEAFDRGE